MDERDSPRQERRRGAPRWLRRLLTRSDEAARRSALGEQFEDLLGTVWQLEREWEFDDRLELGFRSYPARRR